MSLPRASAASAALGAILAAVALLARGGNDVVCDGEGDDVVRAKVQAAVRAGLVPLLCVGEGLAVRKAGEHVAHTTAQLRAALEGLPADAARSLVVAYEPVWAIGTGRTPTESDIAAIHAAIRARLRARFGEAGGKLRILYGGSVKPANAAAILALENVDGALVGGASLDPDGFARIVSAAPAP